MKKILVVCLALIMTLSLATSAMASEPAIQPEIDTSNITVRFATDGNIEVVDANGNIVPRAYYEWWELSDSKPASGTYNVGGNSQQVNVALNQKVLTMGVQQYVKHMVAKVLGGDIARNAGVVVKKGMQAYFDYIEENLPDSETLYVEKTLWSNGNPDTTSSPMEYYYKIKTTYYTDWRFDEEVSSDTYYGTLYIQNH